MQTPQKWFCTNQRKTIAPNETPASAKNALRVLVVSMKVGIDIVREPVAADVAVRDPEAEADEAPDLDPEAEPVWGKLGFPSEGI